MTKKSFEEVGLSIVKKNWGWYLLMGILLVVLGMIAIGRTYLFTKVSVVFFGWLMMAAGVSQMMFSYVKERGWGGFLLDLVAGILYVVVGFMIIANPGSTAITMTLLIAMFLLFDGIFRLVSAITLKVPQRAWLALSGVMGIVLGMMIWRQWPYSGVWVIGLFVGIQMIFNGWSTVTLALAAKNLPDEDEPELAAA